MHSMPWDDVNNDTYGSSLGRRVGGESFFDEDVGVRFFEGVSCSNGGVRVCERGFVGGCGRLLASDARANARGEGGRACF